MARRRSGLVLSAPTVVVFIIAALLIAFGALAYYTDIVDVSVDTAVLALTAGGVLLVFGNLLKNL
jgi:low affinity Fe/Cu permease